MTTGRALARAGLIVSGAFLVARVLGWLRIVVIGNAFGGTPEQLDAFFAAFRLPDLIFQLVAAGALSSALIPIVTGLLATDEERRAWRVVSTIANLVLIALLILAALVAVFAEQLVSIIAPGFGGEQAAQTAELTRVMVLSPVFLALSAVATSVLNSTGRFGAAAMAPIAYNLAIIGAAVILAPSLGVGGLALGVVAGAILALVVQLRPLGGTGFRYAARIDLAEPNSRTALKLMAPRALGLGASQLVFVVATAIASTLGTGAISALTIAFSLLQIPIGLIGVPLGIVLFPALSKEAALGNRVEYAGLLARSLRLLLFVMLPIAALGIVARNEIVITLFGGPGSGFSQEAIALTATTMAVFLIGLPAHSLIAVLARAFYARQDTITPVAAALVAVVVDCLLAFVLAARFDLPGIALAIAIGAWVEALMLLGILRRRTPELELAPLAGVVFRSGVATTAAAAAAVVVSAWFDGLLGADPGRLGALGRLVAITAAGGLAFAAVAAALRIPELPSIIGLMTDILRRPRRA